MREYYVYNGSDQEGPFKLEELSHKQLTKSTLIWYEGLTDWIAAETLEELTPFLNKSIPPPVNKALQVTAPLSRPKKNTLGTILQIIGGIGALLIILAVVSKATDNSQDSTETYEQKVMTVEEMERANPLDFLKASGQYNKNFWGTKIRLRGLIRNNATVAVYKDAVLRVTYYTKTNTELGHKNYTIYEVFMPNSSTNFDFKIDNYRNVESIDVSVVSASIN